MATKERPVCIVCVGMAGSGKTTFMQRINADLHAKKEPPYVVNLDPAVRSVPFESNIDIRDSINYKEVMKQYNLGPNGGILTSLNLFATKVDQIMGILDKRTGVKPPAEGEQPSNSRPIKNILVDTPGQIEVFVWSASGSILLSSLASSFPTVIAYIIDTPRTASTSTFMSNMLYACSILYKTKLPMILVFNKTDVQSANFAKDWMTDFESFQSALQKEEETGVNASGRPVGGGGYMNSLMNSMSLVLEEFYKHLSVVGVSSMTGQGVDEFFKAVRDKAEEFERDYQPELERRQNLRESHKQKAREKELNKLMKDMDVKGPRPKKQSTEQMESISDMEDEDGDEDREGLVERDDDDEEEAGDQEMRMDDALAERYRSAMGIDRGAPLSQEDLSFMRYMREQK